ncbi:MAG: DUF5668 domain-containing protein [Calditrichota bacterium]
MNNETDTKSLDDRIEEIAKRLEEVGRSLGDHLEEHLQRPHIHPRRREHDRLFWGLALIIAGGIWLGDRVGWFNLDLPFWPTALIALGLYMIVTSRRH